VRPSLRLLVSLLLLALSSCGAAPEDPDRVTDLENRLAAIEERLGAVERTTAMSLPAPKETSVAAVLLALAERRDPRLLSENQKLAFFVISGWNPGDFELLRLHVDLEQVYRAQALSLLAADDAVNPTFATLLRTAAGPKLQAASNRLSRIRAMLEIENWTRARELVREPVE